MTRRILLTTCFASLMMAAPSFAAMDIEKMGAATGIAQIIGDASACGYTVDEAALSKYYVEQGLAEPEILAFIHNSLAMKKFGDKASVSECTLSRATAKATGLLAK